MGTFTVCFKVIQCMNESKNKPSYCGTSTITVGKIIQNLWDVDCLSLIVYDINTTNYLLEIGILTIYCFDRWFRTFETKLISGQETSFTNEVRVCQIAAGWAVRTFTVAPGLLFGPSSGSQDELPSFWKSCKPGPEAKQCPAEWLNVQASGTSSSPDLININTLELFCVTCPGFHFSWQTRSLHHFWCFQPHPRKKKRSRRIVPPYAHRSIWGIVCVLLIQSSMKKKHLNKGIPLL